MHARYAEGLTMREARRVYFDVNGFGENGGYDDAWVDFKLGPLPFPFPNTPQRVRAVKYHDLHHVLTGYDTDFRGELEISAWEIGAGCKGFVAAWILNLGGMGAGLFRAPSRSFAAFVRGRRSASLYELPFEPLLDMTVGDARAKHVAATDVRATAGDVVAFAAATAAGILVGLATFALAVPLVPIGLVTNHLRKRALARA
jgi:hypothetical protein